MEKKPKLLFVEDYEGLQDLLLNYWSKKYEISLCVNGLEAWKKITSGYLPDIIVCDFHMAYLNGLELATKLKDEGYKIPFILFSIYFPYSTDNLSEFGIDLFVDKLTEFNFLEGKVEKVLELTSKT